MNLATRVSSVLTQTGFNVESAMSYPSVDPKATSKTPTSTLLSDKKTATSSSNEASTMLPEFAFDGDPSTRWGSIEGSEAGTQWISVDLVIKGSGRYVRMKGTERLTEWGYSLTEFQVWGY